MKAEFQELKGSFGEIRLFPETMDDLWHLQHLVAAGDLVFATTFRSVEAATDKLRPEKVEKKPVRLGIRIEKLEFHPHSSRLRMSGVIESGIDVGFHHTLNIEPGFEVSVIKQWRSVDLERIERAEKASAYGVVHVMSIEEGEAELFRLRQFGPEWAATVTMGSGKGAETDTRAAFFERAYEYVKDVTGPLVIAGPGFIKDDFARFVKRQPAGPGERTLVVETRRVGRGAVQEVIGLGVLESLLGDLHLAREVRLMDEVLVRISKDGAVAYGIEAVQSAVGYGAVEQVIVSDSLLRNDAVAGIMEQAEYLRATVVVLSTEFEPGQRLEALGGIAALLRYKIE